MNRVRTFLQLPLLLVFEVVAVAVLHRLGDAPGLRAGTLVTGFAAPEDAVMAGARLVALGVAWWLLASTLLCAAARACRLPAAVRALEWVALPAVRRLVERSLAAALSLSVAGTMLPAVEAVKAVEAVAAVEAALPAPDLAGGVVIPPVLAMHRSEFSPAALGVQAPQAPGGPVSPRPPLPPLGAPAPPAAPGPSGAPLGGSAPLAAPRSAADLPRRHTVGEGEHLWGLAREVVAQARGLAPTEAEVTEVAAYWVRVIESNPAALRSGDPDLVFPGETLTLPALEG